MVTRITVWLLAIFFIAGCSTVRFTSVKTPTARTPVSAPPTWTSEYTPAVSNSVVAVRKYGNFTVKVFSDDSQVIEGGKIEKKNLEKFQVMPTTSVHAHVIIVNYTSKELLYYRRTSVGAYEPMVGYAVVTPNPSVLPHDEVRGVVRRIDRSPSWCVTPQIRDALLRKEEPVIVKVGCYPFGHKDNAMGTAKFEISWNVPGFAYVRLHGTGGYASGDFWEDTTLGCTRLLNPAMEELVELLGPNAVREGIEVIALRGKVPQGKEETKVVISAE